MYVPAAKTIKYLLLFFAVAAPAIFFTSCTAIKEYPANRPFVYQTNINVEGSASVNEKKVLHDQLYDQLHDSLLARRQRKFIFWTTIRKPPVFDSLNVGKSKLFMNALLNSVGYYRDSISADTVMVIQGDQYRTIVNFTVMPGKLIRFDSVSHNLLDSVAYRPGIDTLQQLTNNSLGQTLIKKGDPFSKPVISGELDRLSDLYRDNGYLRFSRDQLIAVWDTVGINLLRLSFDPAEQLQLLEELRNRRENPRADIEIRLRPEPDTLKLTRYYIAKVRIYPDFDNDIPDSQPTIDTLTRNQYEYISYKGLFKTRKLSRFIYLKRGELYKQSNLLRTQNKFNSLGAWRLVSITPIPRSGQDSVDFEIRLTPAKQFNTSVNLDVSYNQSNLASEGNLVGFGTTLTHVNHNLGRAANQATTNVRFGIELSSKNTIQTQQFTIGHTIQYPRLVPRMLWIPQTAREDARTFLALNAGYTDRIDYYHVNSFNASWGYEFNWKNLIVGIRLPNIEYNLVDKRSQLLKLQEENASYKYIFNNGLIISGLVNFTIAGGRKGFINVGRISVEEAGLITGLFQPLFPSSQLYRFVKVDAEFVQTKKIRRTALAWRIFGGVGDALPFALKSGKPDSNNLWMPFFRQYYAGGPNSMRAWVVRQLGPGSTIRSFDKDTAPDRFGDIRLELNGEYRFYMTTIFGFVTEGALFTDIGNVWFLRPNGNFPEGSFRLNKLWKDIAIGAGTGIRIDFGLLKARLDYAKKVKNPSPDANEAESQNVWFYRWGKNPFSGQFQLGINYPF